MTTASAANAMNASCSLRAVSGTFPTVMVHLWIVTVACRMKCMPTSVKCSQVAGVMGFDWS